MLTAPSWLDASLLATLGLMGLASVPHCALMCGAPCAAVVGARRGAGPGAVGGFQVGRLLSYAAAGAMAAASMAWLREASTATRLLQPVWTLLHSALFALGLYLLISARWPGFLGRSGVSQTKSQPVRWQHATGSGLLWAAWPCGVLQGALLVAALASSPASGAAAMAAFALASSPGLLLAPAALQRLMARPDWQAWAPRLAGAMLLLASSFALGHGLWARFVEWCT
jgi:sulfite exporter TauE/SafE